MPRIVLKKIHPPTSIEVPDREKGAILLLPGIPKKVTADEVAFIKKNFPALSFGELPTKIRKRGKPRVATTAAASSSILSPTSKSDDEEKESDDDEKSLFGKKKKKRGR